MARGAGVSVERTGGLLFIVSSPSGGGKTTLIRHCVERLGTVGVDTYFSVSHTTRAPRPGERDGVDYHFVDRDRFEAMVRERAFLEWAEYAGNLYGTSRVEVEGRLERGVDVFLDIEVQGASQVKRGIEDAVKIFVYPPSYEVLKRRLTDRRQDADEVIRRRLEWALREFDFATFEYAIINDRLDRAVDALYAICLAEHHRDTRMRPTLDAIRDAYQASLEKDTGT